MKEKRGIERERESTLRAELKWPYLCISPFDWAGFGIDYDPHHPLTSDCWDRKALVLCERNSPRNSSRKHCLHVSHGHWRFPLSSTVGSRSILDTLVILRRSLF